MNAPTRSNSRPALIGTLLVFGLISGAFSISVWAQPSGEPDGGYWDRGVAPASDEGRGRGGPPKGGHPLLVLFDADQDGVISAEEIDHAAETLLSIDANGDGAVSDDELGAALPPPPDRRMGRPRGPSMGPPPNADF